MAKQRRVTTVPEKGESPTGDVWKGERGRFLQHKGGTVPRQNGLTWGGRGLREKKKKEKKKKVSRKKKIKVKPPNRKNPGKPSHKKPVRTDQSR